MLPYLCDVAKNRQENGSKMPSSTNLASQFISDVSYATKKLEDGSTVSFLKFKLFIRRKSTEYRSNRQFMLAYSEPYSYTRLQFLMEEL